MTQACVFPSRNKAFQRMIARVGSDITVVPSVRCSAAPLTAEHEDYVINLVNVNLPFLLPRNGQHGANR